MNNTKVIYLAGGCFWGTEHAMRMLRGVIDIEVGYANGRVTNPTYEEVCTGLTNAAETVKVVYNPDEVELETILKAYFIITNPEFENRQGFDVGTQYRSGIYYVDEADEPIIRDYLAAEEQKHEAFYVELEPLESFYKAEDYHQDYLLNNHRGYCHVMPSDFEHIKSL